LAVATKASYQVSCSSSPVSSL